MSAEVIPVQHLSHYASSNYDLQSGQAPISERVPCHEYNSRFSYLKRPVVAQGLQAM